MIGVRKGDVRSLDVEPLKVAWPGRSPCWLSGRCPL